MNVRLVTSPHVRHVAVLQSDFAPDSGVMYAFAPLGLLSLTAVLLRDRPEIVCDLYDLNRRILAGALPLTSRFYASVAEELCAGAPEVVGFMTECDSYHHVLRIAAEVKRVDPACAVVLGGPHATAVAKQTLARCDAVDAIVLGEGEATFPELLDTLFAGSRVPVAGALRRGRNGEVVEGGPRALVDSLDDLPIPAYERYQPDPGEEMFVEAGRGCPFQCRFCSTAPFWRRRHRVKSPQRILEEVLRVQGLFGTTRVHFTHDLFTTHRAWVEGVCETLIQAGAPVEWTCSARTDTVDEPLLGLMAAAGCRAIYFGIESGSERILAEIHKAIPLAHSFDMLEASRRQGIVPNAGFIVGFPTEDAESLRASLDAYERALRLGCRPAHLFAYCPFAGSAMYPELSRLECQGHFVDLPLGMEADLENRRTVTGDAELHGAYFRPVLPDLVPGDEAAVEALDEFSPLVEASLVPTLALARLQGGMYEVFRAWLQWIRSRNDGRGAARFRRGYGSPTDFAEFVLEALDAEAGCPGPALAAARAVLMNLQVVERRRITAGMTMASHRSLKLPDAEPPAAMTLETRLSLGPVIATLALDYDVVPALLGQVDAPEVEEPTFLVRQATEDGVRLLRVEEFVFSALQALRNGSGTAAEVILERFSITQRSQAPQPVGDAFVMLESLQDAAREGLVRAGV